VETNDTKDDEKERDAKEKQDVRRADLVGEVRVGAVPGFASHGVDGGQCVEAHLPNERIRLLPMLRRLHLHLLLLSIVSCLFVLDRRRDGEAIEGGRKR